MTVGKAPIGLAAAWRRAMDARIGIVPVLVLLAILALVAGFVALGEAPSETMTNVATLMGVGFLVGRLVGMDPIEGAIVNATHSGQGGTGDVAILTAADRMPLMPFAQIATRIGGAITVTLILIAFAKLGAPA